MPPECRKSEMHAGCRRLDVMCPQHNIPYKKLVAGSKMAGLNAQTASKWPVDY